ncbi:MAG TPA: hypothetical protein VGK70_11130, partial [Thermoanaerobaculia bacterium]
HVVCGDPARGKLLLLDSVTGKSIPLRDINLGRNPAFAKIGLARQDDRTIFFAEDKAEANIWMRDFQ